MLSVSIASRLLDAMLVHAAATHPLEACGLLFGRARDHVLRVQPAANVAPDPAAGFEIDPTVLLAAQRLGRAAGERLLGWYHSHPAGPPEPSARDAEGAFEAGRLWLILAGRAVAAFETVGPGRFAPCRLVVEDGSEASPTAAATAVRPAAAA